MKFNFRHILLVFLLISLFINPVFSIDSGLKTPTNQAYSSSLLTCPSSWGTTLSERLDYFFCGVKAVVINEGLMDGIGIIALFLGVFSLMFFLLNKRIIKDVKVSKVLALMISFFTVAASIMLVNKKGVGVVLFFGGWALLVLLLLISIGLFIGIFKWVNKNYPDDEHKNLRYGFYIGSILLILALFLDAIRYVNIQTGINSDIILGIISIIDNIFVISLIVAIFYFIFSVGSGFSSSESSSGISKIVDSDIKKINNYKGALNGFLRELSEVEKLSNDEVNHVKLLLNSLQSFLVNDANIMKKKSTKVEGDK